MIRLFEASRDVRISRVLLLIARIGRGYIF